MKKSIAFQICLIPAVLAVLATCFSGCSANEVFTQESYTADSAQIAEVSIDVRDRQIEVTLSADNQIHLAYSESDKEYYDISVSEENVLTMTAAGDKNWTDYIGGKPASDNRKISLQLPDNLLTALTLSTTNEPIALPALTVTENISLSTNNDNLSFVHLQAGNAITLKNKNGNITGSIAGSFDDYKITSESKKGECNLPESKENGSKILNVSNNNGDVKIDFVGE